MHGGDGGGLFWRIWSENGPVYLFGVISVYKILEDSRMGAGQILFPKLNNLAPGTTYRIRKFGTFGDSIKGQHSL